MVRAGGGAGGRTPKLPELGAGAGGGTAGGDGGPGRPGSPAALPYAASAVRAPSLSASLPPGRAPPRPSARLGFPCLHSWMLLSVNARALQVGGRGAQRACTVPSRRTTRFGAREEDAPSAAWAGRLAASFRRPRNGAAGRQVCWPCRRGLSGFQRCLVSGHAWGGFGRRV